MKCSIVRVTLNTQDALNAGKARLGKRSDSGVTTEEEAESYTGAVFEEDGLKCTDLHIMYRDGMACVNFLNEEGVRVNYDYPICSVKRIAHKENAFLH